MIHSMQSLGLIGGDRRKTHNLPGTEGVEGYSDRWRGVVMELRLHGGDTIYFIASLEEECEYSEFIFFARDLFENKSSTVDLWGTDFENPYVLEYCSEDEILYVTLPREEEEQRKLLVYHLPEIKRMSLVHAFRIVAMTCLENQCVSSMALP